MFVTFCKTLSTLYDTQHNGTRVFMLSVTYAKCFCLCECHQKALCAERRYAQCHYTDCHGAVTNNLAFKLKV